MSDTAGGGGTAADATIKAENGEAAPVDHDAEALRMEHEHAAEVAAAENALERAKESVKRAEAAVKEAKRGHN